MTDVVTIEWSLRLAEIAVIIGGTFTLAIKIGRAVERFELVGRQQGDEIKELKDDIRILNNLVTQIAVQDTRLNMIDARVEELRHGKGMVVRD